MHAKLRSVPERHYSDTINIGLIITDIQLLSNKDKHENHYSVKTWKRSMTQNLVDNEFCKVEADKDIKTINH